MPMRRDPRTWPITLKVPLAVAALMVLVGVVLVVTLFHLVGSLLIVVGHGFALPR